MSLLSTWLLEAAMIVGMDAKADAGARAILRRGSGTPIASAPGRSLKILIVTDAWAPQVNGVVRTLETMGRELRAMGHVLEFATPERHRTVPLPTYPQIRVALFPRCSLKRTFEIFEPDAVHIATEGTLGLSARALCIEERRPFTTSLTTRFPEYIHMRLPLIPKSALYAALRAFHAPAHAVMVSTPSFMHELQTRGFRNMRLWSRGVDVERFRPGVKNALDKLGLAVPRPIFLYVGRIAVEKNVQAFLALDLPGTKVVIGDGPQRAELEKHYPAVVFLGQRAGDELVAFYSAGDVLVFPSRTDTFGLVMLEALACGIPVAGYPVQGPLSVIGSAPVGVLDRDLRSACIAALDINPARCRAYAVNRSWRDSTEQFLRNLAPTRVVC